MKNMTIEEMEDFIMLEEMRALKDEPTITYDEFLQVIGWSRKSHKNQSISNDSINHLRR
jgi:hypothetical protein